MSPPVAPRRDARHRFNNDLRYGEAVHERNTQFTPLYLLSRLRFDFEYGIGLDPCTTPDNPVGAEVFYTVESDGLTQPWHRPGVPSHGWMPSVFVNPPYAKAREPWVEKCIEAGTRGQRVVLLIPAATDTRIWQKAAATSTAIVFVKGRVKFGTLRPNRRQHAASHPSCLIGWNTDLRASASLGFRIAISQHSPGMGE